MELASEIPTFLPARLFLSFLGKLSHSAKPLAIMGPRSQPNQHTSANEKQPPQFTVGNLISELVNEIEYILLSGHECTQENVNC